MNFDLDSPVTRFRRHSWDTWLNCFGYWFAAPASFDVMGMLYVVYIEIEGADSEEERQYVV